MRRDHTFKVCANHVVTADLEDKPMAGSDKALTYYTADHSGINAVGEYTGEVFTELFAFRFKTAGEYQEWRDALDRCKRRDFAGFTRVWAMDASQRPARKDEPDLVAEEGDAADQALPKVGGGTGAGTPGGTSTGGLQAGQGGALLFGTAAPAGLGNTAEVCAWPLSATSVTSWPAAAALDGQAPPPPLALPAGGVAVGGGAAVPWGGLRNVSSSSTSSMSGSTSALGLGAVEALLNRSLLNRSLFDPPPLNQTLLAGGAGAGAGGPLGAPFPVPAVQSPLEGSSLSPLQVGPSSLSPSSAALGKDKEAGGGNGAESGGAAGGATGEAAVAGAAAAGAQAAAEQVAVGGGVSPRAGVSSEQPLSLSTSGSAAAGASINPFLSAEAGA